MPFTTWTAVVPLKGLDGAKSRLASLPQRRELALAMAHDTLTTCSVVLGSRVVVVSDDPAHRLLAARLAVTCVPDPGAGLDAAVLAGVRGGDVVALVGDLPCLRPADLRQILRTAAEVPRGYVPDLEGSGTVALTACGVALEPSFGPGSASRHAAVARSIHAPERARLDVDDVADLHRAAALGTGPRTASVLREMAPALRAIGVTSSSCPSSARPCSS